ncbi:ERCC1, partial [Cervus elaphus hippelaphus]
DHRELQSSRTIESCAGTAPLLYSLGERRERATGLERPEVRRAWGRAGRGGGGKPLSPFGLFLTAGRGEELAMDEEAVQKPAGPPARKKFLIPMDEGVVPPPGTYAEYALSGPPGRAEATRPVGPEPLAGEAPKPGAKSNSIIVSPRQRGNPVLRFVRNVPWEFGDVLPDYKDPQQALKELAKMCVLADCTLILAWSPEEAGRYLETYKAYEQKPADLLMEKLEQDFVSRVTECLTTVKSVNKTDSQTLLTTFGSLEQLIAASREDLSLCPGLGPQKARRLFDVFHEPFLKVPH